MRTGCRAGEVALLVVGGVGLVAFGYLCLELHVALPRVDPSQLGHGVVYRGSGLDWQWLAIVAISSLTMVCLVGLPSGSTWSARGTVRGAVGQGIGGLVIGCWAACMAVFSSAFYFMGPGDGCTYPSCWPLHEQMLALLLPGVLTAAVMVVLALLVRRVPWIVRALTPPIVWIAGLLVQHWVWMTYLLPAFESPPG